jgi:hypothetical protein
LVPLTVRKTLSQESLIGKLSARFGRSLAY